MRPPRRKFFTPIRVVTTILGGMTASLLLAFGVGNLINPDVADGYEAQNTRVCVTLIITGFVSIYAIFRPYSGGMILCVCAAALGFVSWVFNNPISIALLLVGGLFIIYDRLSQDTVSKKPDQRS